MLLIKLLEVFHALLQFLCSLILLFLREILFIVNKILQLQLPPSNSFVVYLSSIEQLSAEENTIRKINEQSKGNEKKWLDMYYKTFPNNTGTFAEKNLPGRKELVTAVLKRALNTIDEKLVWVDFGSGDASILNLVDVHLLVNRFEKIILIERAKTRVEQLRQKANKYLSIIKYASQHQTPAAETVLYGRIVEIIHLEDDDEDVATEKMHATLQDYYSKVHICTFFYSLSMMKNWMKMLRIAYRLLKTEHGVFAASDFFIPSSHLVPTNSQMHKISGSFISNWLLTKQLYSRHFFANPQQTQMMQEYFDQKSDLQVRTMQQSLLWLVHTPYYTFIGNKPTSQQRKNHESLEKLVDFYKIINSKQKKENVKLQKSFDALATNFENLSILSYNTLEAKEQEIQAHQNSNLQLAAHLSNFKEGIEEMLNVQRQTLISIKYQLEKKLADQERKLDVMHEQLHNLHVLTKRKSSTSTIN